jgi:hypothetical protein
MLSPFTTKKKKVKVNNMKTVKDTLRLQPTQRDKEDKDQQQIIKD